MSFVNQYRSTNIYGELKVQKYNTGNIAGLLDVSGNSILRGDVGVYGNLYAADGTVDISGNLAVSGNISGTFSGSVANATNTTNVLIATDASNQSFYPTFVRDISGNLPLKVDSDLTYNPSTNTLTVSNITGTCSSATNATNSTNATNATNADVASQVTVSTTNTGTRYLGMFAGSGNRTCLIDTDLTYDAASNTLTVSNITGTCSNATNAVVTSQMTVSTTNTGTRYLCMFAGSGDRTCLIDTDLTYNASTNTLTVQNINVPFINDVNFITSSTNTVIGALSLNSVTTGGSNTALGNEALNSITTGSSNVAIGDGAIRTGTAAGQNIAIGRNALELGTADSNVAVGNEALSSTSSGSQNVGVGSRVLGENTTGSNNTSIGHSSGAVMVTGTYNTFLGYEADIDASGNTWNNSTAIGASCKITASNTIFMGTTSETVNVLGSLTKSRIAFKTQSYASGGGATSVNLANGNHFFITGTNAFTLTLPNSSLNDGDFLYLRKTSSTAFVVTLSWSTVSLINTSNVSQTSTNATLFAGGVFELKMIYRATNTSWYLTNV